MKRFAYIALLIASILMPVSCVREEAEETLPRLPDGTPVTLLIPFGAVDDASVDVLTKAEASRVDESRVHDIYVLIFDSAGSKFYGRYFTYEHLSESLSVLGNNSNEGWYVDNVSISDASDVTTKGVVKISTEAKTGCTMVVIANLDNAVTSLDGDAPIDRIAEISTLTELQSVKVQLEQNVVNRDDLFLMLGYISDLSTSDMVWYANNSPDYITPVYNETYKVSLNRIDAKVKFRIRVNSANIDSVEPRYWQVLNVPSSCYLYPSNSDTSGEDRYYFDTDESYFEDVETDSDGTWQVFTFYMLENRKTAKQEASSYYDREKQEKVSTGESSGVIYKNGDWLFAPDKGTYVKFHVILTLNSTGIAQILQDGSGQALTTDAIYTVHLGDFTNDSINNYKTERSHAYTYNIVVNNSNSIYVEVTDEDRTTEPEAGQEGSLLFATDEIVQCDAHYSYHSMTFRYNPSLNKSKVSWDVKTPFGEGGSNWDENLQDWKIDDSVVDYEWVKFAINEDDGIEYSDIRQGYPGDRNYDKNWTPSSSDPRPLLLNIQQLIQYLFAETEKEATSAGSSDFLNGVIRMTAFVNEYYYELDPRTGSINADLWREFVNASPREMHILSDASVSADGQSDIVQSSHSIIQKSIQTIYNISSPFLSSIWGTEHVDEMRNRGPLEDGYSVNSGWKWSNNAALTTSNDYCNDYENGRYNTLGLWGLNPTPNNLPHWDTYLKYNVENSVPELRDGTDGGSYTTNYQLMAYSCLTRNRDNDGNTYIDKEEVRWYLAAVNQLTGMWVGNEALSPSARIYQPHNVNSDNGYDWRSHVVSSTCDGRGDSNLKGGDPIVVVGEEGTSIYYYNSRWKDALPNNSLAETDWNKIQSVRCVRNVGTYQDNGITKDISYAPANVGVDRYYESTGGYDANGRLNPNLDGTYTLRFDNLNTKSIREYTAIDLPYHSEYSAHNRVYLELNIQDPTNIVTASSMNMYDLNNTITEDGHNAYCPTGYRLPNMTELSLMRALMPASYWKTNNGGTARPSRTYFSKGYLGSRYSTETNKIGWIYSLTKGYINLTEYNNNCIDGLRCVRDQNVTGEIAGKLSLSKNRLYVNNTTEIKFNFTSSASVFTDAALALCYTDSSGNEKELSVPIENLEFYGLNLRGSFNYTIPADLPARGSISFKATLKNSTGVVQTFSTPATILSNIEAGIKLTHCDYDDNKALPQFPILVNAFCEDSGVISSWKLKVVTPDGNSSLLNLTPGTTSSWSMEYDYNFTSFSNLQLGTYTFQLLVTDNTGVVVRSDEVSMDILLKDTQPDGEKWSVISNSQISGNDFIEAKIDLANSANKYRENIISIGTTIEGTYNNTYAYHLYYPDNTNNNRMLLDPVPGTGSIGSRNPFLTVDGLEKSTKADLLIFRMDSDGVFWNGIDYVNFGGNYNATKKEQYYTLLSTLCSSTVLLIGSKEGDRRSHADYKYIRVVHNGDSSDMIDANGNFENDPINGGDL